MTASELQILQDTTIEGLGLLMSLYDEGMLLIWYVLAVLAAHGILAFLLRKVVNLGSSQ